jgi:ABC-type sugar transport system permease subunit
MKGNITPYLFLAPPLFFLSFMMLYPIGYTIYMSFTDVGWFSPKINFIGLENYFELFEDPRFRISLINNVIWIIMSLAIPVLLGLMFALLIDCKVKGEVFFKGVFYLPMALSFVATGLIFSWIFDPGKGILNQTLHALGLGKLAQPWLGSATWALPSIIIAASWQYTGFCMVIFLASLRSIPPQIIEQALVDGASDLRVIRYVTLPLIRPGLTVVIALTLIGSLKVFDLVWVMTQGGPAHSSEVLGVIMYDYAIQSGRLGYGSSIAVIMFILSLIIATIYIKKMITREVIY